jgi:hypothetical protein
MFGPEMFGEELIDPEAFGVFLTTGNGVGNEGELAGFLAEGGAAGSSATACWKARAKAETEG